MSQSDYQERRRAMVDLQIRGRGIESPLVLEAMGRVHREAFVPEKMRELAYEDSALPVLAGQTISQPYVVAMMVDALGLAGGGKVLDVGTGSGYGAAVLACVADQVFSIERLPELAERAREVLTEEGFRNVQVRTGDGSLGWPEEAPFNGIVVAAGSPAAPDSLKKQLKIGGCLIIPVGGERSFQKLMRIRRVAWDDYKSEELSDVRFVPLVGEEGWQE